MNSTDKGNRRAKKSWAIRLEGVAGKTIAVSGRFLRIARIKDEVCDEGIQDPGAVIAELCRQRCADIFTFPEVFPGTTPRHSYYYEMDNRAVLPVTDYQYWWNHQIKNDARRMVRKAEKSGISVRVVALSDELVLGIKRIYDESFVRQGRPFWHFNKSLERVRDENATFRDRSVFIGAYLNEELIGFNKIFYTGVRADQIQLICMLRERDKAPTNALIAKAVEVVSERGMKYLTYGKFSYGNKSGDSLGEFKQRNGFSKVCFPRYFVPLSAKGTLAIRLGLHKRLIETLPPGVVDRLLHLRTTYYAWRRR